MPNKLSKGAMFCLDFRVLRKQFGELFLVRSASGTLVRANGGSGYTKRAAMFGLDARIALAIFGALSVISGAALYSAIQHTKVISVVTELKEIGKAWEQYYLDTGQPLSYSVTGNGTIPDRASNIENLLVNTDNVANWNGPYVSYQENQLTNLKHNTYQDVHITLLNDSFNWGDEVFWWENAGSGCTATNCFAWAQITGVPNDAVAYKIDQIIDGGDGLDSGNFRAAINSPHLAHNNRVLYKIAPYKI